MTIDSMIWLIISLLIVLMAVVMFLKNNIIKLITATIEVKYNTVEQYACFGDELPEKDVVNRINEWKKAKKLR